MARESIRTLTIGNLARIYNVRYRTFFETSLTLVGCGTANEETADFVCICEGN